MKKIIYAIIIVILSIVVIFNLCSVFNIGLFGYRTFKVATGSMEPTIKIGEVIITKENDKYKIGDIVTYKYNDSYITHRIIYVENDKIVTKGDANNITDDPIKKSDIVGKVVVQLKFITFINVLIANPLTWLLLTVVGVIVVLLLPKYKKRNGCLIDDDIL